MKKKPGLRPNPFRCPKCGGTAIDVDGDPFARAFDPWMPMQELHIHTSTAQTATAGLRLRASVRVAV